MTDRAAEKTNSTLKGNERDNYIENKWYKITFDVRNGGIKSVWDKINRRELIDIESTDKFGSYIYERYDQKQSLQYLKEYILMIIKNHIIRLPVKVRIWINRQKHVINLRARWNFMWKIINHPSKVC